jgi:ribose 5-phosphate isomerase B
MKVFLASDHGGFKLKEEIKNWLNQWNFEFEDMGNAKYDTEDDYPDFAWPAAVKVGTTPGSFGILICRSGQGESIVANKAKGARAAIAWNEHSAHAARNDDDANIVCIPADYVTLDQAKAIAHDFLTTKFGKDPRFKRRVDKIKKIDINL